MQVLFQWDFFGALDNDPQLDHYIHYVRTQFAPEFDDDHYIRSVVGGVVTNHNDIDTLITQYATEWPLDQITRVDRTILRLGIYELRFADAIPAKVAINEAVELGKTFGGEASGRFINGVMGAIYNSMVEGGITKEVDRKKQQEALEAQEEAAAANQSTTNESMPKND